MSIHSLLVESVYLRRLGGSAGGHDFRSDSYDRCEVAPGEKKLGPLAREGACDRPADRATGAVDHRNFAVQHQYLSFLSAVVTYAQLMS
jgi:hypothetical protein